MDRPFSVVARPRTGRVVMTLGAALLVLPGASAAPPAEAAGGASMRAIRYHEYGTTSVLRLEQVARPVPGEEQVLVQIHAAAANPLDWHYMRGTPYLLRLDAGLSRPEDPSLGVDAAGVVVAVGARVTQFKVGDRVFGAAPGSFAEFALAKAQRVAPIPAGVSDEQAAALPIAALTALQGLRDKGRVARGDRVLINGASGGVGTFAVQLAKTMGAHVTGVCSGRNVAMVRQLGADRVIDYTRDDFTRGADRYDVVLDLVGNRSLPDVRRVLAPKGRYVLIGGGGPNDGRWIGPFARTIQGFLLDPFVGQEFTTLLASVNADDLRHVAGLVQQGKLVPVVDRRYPLDRVPEAIDYLESGRARGKVIVTVTR